MSVGVDLSEAYIFKVLNKLGGKFIGAFKDPGTAIYWIRLFSAEILGNYFAFAAVLQANPEVNRHYTHAALAKTITALVVDSLSWPYWMYCIMEEPPKGVTKLGFIILNTELVATILQSSASTDLLIGAYYLGESLPVFAILSMIFSIVSMTTTLYFVWIPHFAVFLVPFGKAVDPDEGSCLPTRYQCCKALWGFLFSGLMLGYTAVTLTAAFSNPEKVKCAPFECFAEDTCKPTTTEKGLNPSNKEDEIGYLKRVPCVDSGAICGVKWGCEAECYKQSQFKGTLADDDDANDGGENAYTEESPDDDENMCLGSCWWGFESEEDCEAFFMEEDSFQPVNVFYAFFGVLLGYAVAITLCSNNGSAMKNRRDLIRVYKPFDQDKQEENPEMLEMAPASSPLDTVEGETRQTTVPQLATVPPLASGTVLRVTNSPGQIVSVDELKGKGMAI